MVDADGDPAIEADAHREDLEAWPVPEAGPGDDLAGEPVRRDSRLGGASELDGHIMHRVADGRVQLGMRNPVDDHHPPPGADLDAAIPAGEPAGLLPSVGNVLAAAADRV